MAREDTHQTLSLRDMYGFRRRYDISLACAFEPDSEPKCQEKFGFYDAIGEVVCKIEKRPFLPHRNIDLDFPPEKVYDIINGIIIPTSDLVIAYLGIESIAAGMMIGRAVLSDVPIIYLRGLDERASLVRLGDFLRAFYN